MELSRYAVAPLREGLMLLRQAPQNKKLFILSHALAWRRSKCTAIFCGIES